MRKQLLVYGVGSLGEKIYHYNKRDCLFDMIGFIDDKAKPEDIFCSLPVYTFDRIKDLFSPQECVIFVAIGYVKCNYYRELVCNKVKEAGYSLTNYISPNSICFEGVELGENILLCDNVFVGHGSRLEDGAILSVGCTLSHENYVGKYSFISSAVVFGGHAKVMNNCFVGLHSTVRDSVVIEKYNIVGSGTNVIKSTEPFSVTIGNPGVSKTKDTMSMSV
jgi:sugar O-acyltransferase (sialic acid O-acetyltransferase NeuD family)